MMRNDCFQTIIIDILMLEKFLGFQTDNWLRIRSDKLHQKG